MLDALAPIEAELVPLPDAGRLPHPNLLLALLLALLPVALQVIASMWTSTWILMVWTMVRRFTQGRWGQPAEVAEAINDVLVPLATSTNLLVAVVVVGLAFGRRAPQRVAWRNCSALQWLLTFLLVPPLALVASEVSNCMSLTLDLFQPDWLENFTQENSQVFADFAQQSWIVVFLGACLLPGVGEEIYCRGLIGRGLVARYGVWAGTIFAAFIFAAMHIEPVQASSAFVLGIALQYLFLTTRSLAAPILLHVLNNFGAFLVLRYDQAFHIPGLSLPPDGTIVHTPVWLLTAALAAIGFLSGVLYQTRTQWLLPNQDRWSPGYVTAESPPAELQARAVSARPHGLLVVLTLTAYAAFLASLIAAHQPPA
jgi:membrane protease YdiL (CAAX protease family)